MLKLNHKRKKEKPQSQDDEIVFIQLSLKTKPKFNSHSQLVLSFFTYFGRVEIIIATFIVSNYCETWDCLILLHSKSQSCVCSLSRQIKEPKKLIIIYLVKRRERERREICHCYHRQRVAGIFLSCLQHHSLLLSQSFLVEEVHGTIIYSNEVSSRHIHFSPIWPKFPHPTHSLSLWKQFIVSWW